MGGAATGTVAVGWAQPAAISNRPLVQNSQLRKMQVLAITNMGLPGSLFIPAVSEREISRMQSNQTIETK
jgi:hypothetical protein